jgi:hypothetical protein
LHMTASGNDCKSYAEVKKPGRRCIRRSAAPA